MLALTHSPSPHMHRALRTIVEESPIDQALAAQQHAGYCRMLEKCGATVRVLNANAEQPDCVFIEDTAIVLDEVAILCSMGHESRRAEPLGIEPVLREYREVRRIELPAAIDGGDVLRVGKTLLVGRTGRTNIQAIAALKDIVGPFGYRVLAESVHGCLHLKSAVTALPDGRLLLNPDWINVHGLAEFSHVLVPPEEPDAANVALVNGTVCISAAYPHTIEMLRGLGFAVEAVELDEFAKADGCVTCLSLLLQVDTAADKIPNAGCHAHACVNTPSTDSCCMLNLRLRYG